MVMYYYHMAAKQRALRTPAERGMYMTTVELPDTLVRRARIHAIRHRTTLRALIEQGLREVLARKEDTTVREEPQ